MFIGDSTAMRFLEPDLRPGEMGGVLNTCLAGCAGGFLQCVVAVPAEVVKCVMQVEGSAGATAEVASSAGANALHRGTGAQGGLGSRSRGGTGGGGGGGGGRRLAYGTGSASSSIRRRSGRGAGRKDGRTGGGMGLGAAAREAGGASASAAPSHHQIKPFHSATAAAATSALGRPHAVVAASVAAGAMQQHTRTPFRSNSSSGYSAGSGKAARLQENIFVQTFRTGQRIWRQEGLRGFYKGFGATTLRDVPSISVYFFTYKVTKDFLMRSEAQSKALLLQTPQPVSDAAARKAASSAPVSSDAQQRDCSAEAKLTSRGSAFAFKSSSGSSAEEPSDEVSPGGTDDFAVDMDSESAPTISSRNKGTIGANCGSNNNNNNNGSGVSADGGGSYQKPSAVVSLVSGAAAGAASWSSVYPVDVIKTTQQLAPVGPDGKAKGIVQTARELHASHGSKVFYRGMGTCVLRAIPVNAATFFCYEQFKDLLSD